MKTLAIICTAILLGTPASAQQKPTEAFHGATATAKHYRVVYQLNSDDDKIIRATLRNISNALADPRLNGKLEVELVAHGGGVTVFRKDAPYKEQLLELQTQGVILAECENTMRERKISKVELHDFISYVPSGNGELIIRQEQGWAIIHP